MTEDDCDSSDSDSEFSPMKKRHNWITPEKEELFEGLPGTVLGVHAVRRGQVKDLYENSKFI